MQSLESMRSMMEARLRVLCGLSGWEFSEDEEARYLSRQNRQNGYRIALTVPKDPSLLVVHCQIENVDKDRKLQSVEFDFTGTVMHGFVVQFFEKLKAEYEVKREQLAMLFGCSIFYD